MLYRNIRYLKIDVYGKPQTANFKYLKVISTRFRPAKLLIHASILMQNTVLKSKYDLKFAVCGYQFAVNVNLKGPINIQMPRT